jgi:hypothetical protein
MKALLLILIVAIAGCTGDHSEDQFDLEKVNRAAAELIELNLSNGPVEAQWWSIDLVALRPKAVRKTEQGIFIQLKGMFSAQSGLFIATDNEQFLSSSSSDPRFKKLTNTLYSYHFED